MSYKLLIFAIIAIEVYLFHFIISILLPLTIIIFVLLFVKLVEVEFIYFIMIDWFKLIY